MKRKRILMVNKFYPPIVGGIETVVKDYALMLKEMGYDVTVLTAKKNFSLKTDITKEEGLTVVRSASFGTLLSMPFSFSLLVFFFCKYRMYDIIHFHEPFPLASLMSFFKFRKNQKIIVTWHSDIIRQKLLKPPAEMIQRQLLKKASQITSTSVRLVETSSLLRKHKNKIQVIPLSINIKEYQDPGGLLPEGLLPNQYILYLGRLSSYKGIRILLQAYLQSKVSLPLVIAGQGKESKHIKNFILSNPDCRIIFLNSYVSHEEKLHLLANCAFLVLPSIFPSEAFGIIQLEAMAFKKPIINTSLPTGVPWVSIHGLTGITVPPGNISELAQAIVMLSRNDDIREKLGRNGRDRVFQYFSHDYVINILKGLYESI